MASGLERSSTALKRRKPVQHVNQFGHIGHVQTHRRFIQQVQRRGNPVARAGLGFGQFGNQFNTRGLAAGQGRAVLA